MSNKCFNINKQNITYRLMQKKIYLFNYEIFKILIKKFFIDWMENRENIRSKRG